MSVLGLVLLLVQTFDRNFTSRVTSPIGSLPQSHDALFQVKQKLSSPDSGSFFFCVRQLRGPTTKKFFPHRPCEAVSRHRHWLDGTWHFMITVLLFCVELTDRFGIIMTTLFSKFECFNI